MSVLIEKWKAFQRVFGGLRFILSARQKRLGIITFLLSLIGAFLQMLGVSVIVPLVALMTDPEGMMENPWIRGFCEQFGITSSKTLFLLVCIGTIILYIVKNLFGVFQLWVSTRYANLVERELAMRVMDSYMHRTYDFFLRYDSAKILRDAEQDPQQVNGFLRATFNILNEFLTVLLIILYIIFTDWQMALCIGCIAVLCLFILYRFFKSPMKRMGVVQREAWASHQRVFQEAIGGIKEVQVMRKQDFFLRAYRGTYLEKQRPMLVQSIATAAPTYVIEGLFVSGLMLYICLSSIFDPSFAVMVPLLASFAMGAIRMLPSLGRISIGLNSISYSTPSVMSMAANLRAISEEDETVSGGVREESRRERGAAAGRDAEKQMQRAMRADPGRSAVEEASALSGDAYVSKEIGVREFSDRLCLNAICWHYAGSDKQILKDLDLTVHKGQSIGLIGQTGAGKSTLADIILGLHIPQKGQVLLDGMDIFSIPDDYARIIGYVPQTIYLVDGSIRENVAFGEDPTDVRDEEIWAALEQAQLAEFIRGLEDGLDTVIGERGIRFSGGQRQRLAIARALYRKPQILILDEATSALDNETEAAVMDAIEHLYGTITMIIIAHRLTTVAKCDVVYEIKDGKAVETRLE